MSHMVLLHSVLYYAPTDRKGHVSDKWVKGRDYHEDPPDCHIRVQALLLLTLA